MTGHCPDCASVEILRQAGNGKCHHCYGSGVRSTIIEDVTGDDKRCRHCKGSGICQTCGGGGLVPVSPKPRPYADAKLNPFDDKVAVKVICPKCGALDWFEWKFLGKLTDPNCGHVWYVSTPTYASQQLQATGQAAKKMAKYMTGGLSGNDAWFGKIVGGFCGVAFGVALRLPYGAIMIPIQAAVRISNSKKQAS